MEVKRTRPIKQFRVTQAFGPYQKGALIQPTGIYRDALLARKVIEEVRDELGGPHEELENREIKGGGMFRRGKGRGK